MSDEQRPPDRSIPPNALTGPVPAVAGPVPGQGVSAAWPRWPDRPPSALTTAAREFWADRRPAASVGALACCGAVAVVAGPLTVGYRPGLGLAVLAALVWFAAMPALLRRGRRLDLATAAVSVALAAMVAVRDAGWVVGLCLLGAVGTAVIAAGAARTVAGIGLSGPSAAAASLRAVPWLRSGVVTALGGRRERLSGLLRSLALTLCLLLVFGLLLAQADRVFASYLPIPRLSRVPAQFVVGVLALVVSATLAHLSRRPPSWSELALPPGRPARRAEWLLPVVSLDVLVLAFVLVQLGALLGGHHHVLRTAGLTYAQYARHGFAQLVVVTALTLVVVAVAARRAPRETASDRLVVRVALDVLCLASLGVVASALRRVDLYVETFGMTRLRLVAITAELFLAAVFVLVIAAGLRGRASWLPRAVVLAAAAAVLGLAAVNPDARIVQYDTRAGLARQPDVSYLAGLSSDAVPAMDQLAEPLRTCLLWNAPRDGQRGLRAWNLGRSRAAALLGRTGPVDSAVSAPCAALFVGDAQG
ncbi:DUF4153 domain-containing protein [Angustibacter sp. McL0619]|uniref:DUF4153 domain-containing protein n=1 Tax=Angustibacter sp. McL0619 TaxID=3415676 RepID=UPI003CF311A7